MTELKVVNYPDEDNDKYVVIISFDDKKGKHHDIYEMIDLPADDLDKATKQYANEYVKKFNKGLK